MLLIYAKNTAMKTGWIVTEDIIGPDTARFTPARRNHPDAETADLMCLAMSRYFREDTNMRSRPTLKDAYEGALKYLANREDYTFLNATGNARARILVK